MQKKIAANYTVNESINNFRFRVRIVQQRSLLSELLKNDNNSENENEESRDSNFLIEEEHVFGWQEKIFDPYEVEFYANKEKCITELDEQYHRLITEHNLRGSRLYSRIENDSYSPSDNLLTNRYRSHLSSRNALALPIVRNLKPFEERCNKKIVECKPCDTIIRSNHYSYSDVSRMYILADLKCKDESLINSHVDSETLLCTIIYDKSKRILTVDPNFNNDESPYEIENSSGIRYNYWLMHVSEKHLNSKLHQEEKINGCIFQDRLYRKEDLFQEMQITPLNTLRLFFNFDILSAHEFFYSGLFITYYIDLPQYWMCIERDNLIGRTQRCKIQNKCTYFGYSANVILDYQYNNTLSTNNIIKHWPKLILSVASLDSWSRYRIEGYAAISLPVLPGIYHMNVPTWRPAGNLVNHLRRFFTGNTQELDDITLTAIPTSLQYNCLNKSNLKVVSSGYLKLKMSLIQQNREFTQQSIFWKNRVATLSTTDLIENISKVFKQFEAAKERMLKVKANVLI